MSGKIEKSAAFFSNGLVYGLNGIYLIMPLFLSKYFNSVQAGYLLAIQPFVLCVAPLFWGAITDRAKKQNNIMNILIALSTFSISLLRVNSNFIFVGFALILYSFFQAPYGSLIDVLTIKTAEKYSMNYGVFRITGSIGYAIMAWMITLLPNTENFTFMYAGLAVLAIIAVGSMTKVKKLEVKKDEKDGNIFKLIRNKELRLLIVILALAFFTWGYYTNFFPTYVTETLGLDKSVWGVVAFLSAFSELPFFLYYTKIFKKIRMRDIILISSLAMFLRWIVFATVKNTVILIGVSFITGMFITILTYCVTFYIVTVIAPQLINRAQSLMYAIGTGVPKVLAGCIGGYMTEYMSEPVSFVLCAIISLTGAALAIMCTNTMNSIDERLSRYK